MVSLTAVLVSARNGCDLASPGVSLVLDLESSTGQPRRSVVSREVRDLTRRVCRQNPTCGAPRIHGELLKLSIESWEAAACTRSRMRFPSVTDVESLIGYKILCRICGYEIPVLKRECLTRHSARQATKITSPARTQRRDRRSRVSIVSGPAWSSLWNTNRTD